MQGIETVRRDNCLLVRNVVTTCLEKILIERDEAGAKEYVRRTISDLLMNRLDLSLLVITKVRRSHFEFEIPDPRREWIKFSLVQEVALSLCVRISRLTYRQIRPISLRMRQPRMIT